MASDGAARHELYEQPGATIGARPTETLMSYLPLIRHQTLATVGPW